MWQKEKQKIQCEIRLFLGYIAYITLWLARPWDWSCNFNEWYNKPKGTTSSFHATTWKFHFPYVTPPKFPNTYLTKINTNQSCQPHYRKTLRPINRSSWSASQSSCLQGDAHRNEKLWARISRLWFDESYNCKGNFLWMFHIYCYKENFCITDMSKQMVSELLGVKLRPRRILKTLQRWYASQIFFGISRDEPVSFVHTKNLIWK